MEKVGRVVAAVDVSGISPVVVDVAQRAAKKLGTGVLLVNVVEPILDEEGDRSYLLPSLRRMAEETQKGLEADFMRFAEGLTLPPLGVERQCVILTGRAHTEILHQVRLSDAPLLVIGAPSTHALAATTFGRLLRRSPAPVLVARKPVEEYRRVLVGFDLSPHSRSALTLAAKLAAPDAVFRLVNVLPKTFGPRLFESFEDVRARAEAEMREAAGALLPGREVLCAAVAGTPRSELVSQASEFGADLVAAGVSGKSSMAEVFLGSVAEGVAKNARCDALIFSAGRGGQ